jgi:hypothetical protein
MKGIDVEQFWSETEERLGEKVLINSLGQYLRGEADLPGGTWGLFYLSESALHFQTFPSENWFSLLMRGRGGRSRRKEEASFDVPFASIGAAELASDASLLRKIFAPRPPLVAVEYRSAGGAPVVLEFIMDMRVKEFVKTLRERARLTE